MATKLAVFVVNEGCIVDKKLQEKSTIGADITSEKVCCSSCQLVLLTDCNDACILGSV